MKSRTLSLVAACLMGIAAYAQWTAPEQPTAAGELVSGHSYQIRNAESGDLYLAGGTSWYTWVTSLVLVERSEASTPITYTITHEEGDEAMSTGWTLKNNTGSLYTFISGTIDSDDVILSLYNGLGELHVDMAAQGHNYFDITAVDAANHYYQIQVISADTLYGETSGCLGYIKNDENYPSAVYAFLDPSDSNNGCKWEFVDFTEYNARLDLYDALVESTNYSTIDATVISSATTVYNNASATIEELEEATLAVKTARNNAITQGATQDNPADVTMLIENNDFSTGGVDGWYCSYESGVNATNIGYQSSSYTNTAYTYINHNGEETNPFCSGFIEAWTPNQYGETTVDASLGDGELSQTMKELPAGNYKLSADVIALQQYETVESNYGVQLFATSGDYDMSIDISTGDGVPEHIELLFASSGGDVTLGLRSQSTNCNWIAADNFEMMYYGNESSAYYFILQETISSYESSYPELSEVYANNEVKAAYEEAMANAQSVLSNGGSDEEYTAASDELSAAGGALDASVSEYATVAAKIEYVLSLESQAQENGWDGLVDDLAEYREGTLEPGYYDGTLTSDEIAEMSDTISNMLADYISQNVQAGQDVSILIQNNDFDTDFSGWDVTGSTPAWGGTTAAGQGENTIEGGILVDEIGSGCAEVYWAAFDISQTIQNMPEGLYTLSCQAFERDDAGNGIDAEIYAQVAGEDEQTQKIMDIYTDGSTEQLYGCGEWYDDSSVTLSDGSAGYIPNGMNGANVYFYAGHYYNSMQVLVVERGDLTIGIRNTNTTDWVLFDTFRLVYEGNDASVYKEYIQNLIDEASTLGDNGVLTAEAASKINAAIEEGEDAMDGSDGAACIAAIQSLREAIEFGNTSISLVSDLETLLTYITEVSMSEVESSSEPNYGNLLDEVSSALDDGEFETNAQVEQYMLDLKKGLTVYAQYDFLNATEGEPADITAVILTHESVDVNGDGSTYGWDIDGSVGTGNGCVEMYNVDAGNTFSQTIYGLAAGYYRLGVQGFYRATGYAETVDANDVDTLAYNADLFAGEAATRLCSIKSDAEAYNELAGGTTDGAWSIPTSMETANNAFENRLYNNILQFQVTEDEDEVVIGITKTGLISYDWVIFDNWTLTYLGTTEPSEDATTAIEGAEAAGTAVATAIYSVDGKQLSSLAKGINIVKTTMADGSVKVNKVLVK